MLIKVEGGGCINLAHFTQLQIRESQRHGERQNKPFFIEAIPMSYYSSDRGQLGTLIVVARFDTRDHACAALDQIVRHFGGVPDLGS